MNIPAPESKPSEGTFTNRPHSQHGSDRKPYEQPVPSIGDLLRNVTGNEACHLHGIGIYTASPIDALRADVSLRSAWELSMDALAQQVLAVCLFTEAFPCPEGAPRGGLRGPSATVTFRGAPTL